MKNKLELREELEGVNARGYYPLVKQVKEVKHEGQEKQLRRGTKRYLGLKRRASNPQST